MPSKDAEEFQKRLAEVMLENRKRQNLSQERWADKSGVDRAAISRWEQNKRVPTIMALYDLANALGSSLDELCKEAKGRI
ncbi:MAG: XRE family transcriptional regulator [Verrucomicrobiaceae bacterium]|nr:MAG: XRE family transcriptional regulator [Verrucomicrobiaceae bacterium]